MGCADALVISKFFRVLQESVMDVTSRMKKIRFVTQIILPEGERMNQPHCEFYRFTANRNLSPRLKPSASASEAE